MAVRARGDDVLGAKGRVAAEENVPHARLEGHGVDGGQAVAPKGEANIVFDPGKCVLLANCNQHIIAFDDNVWLARGREYVTPALVFVRRHCLEYDAGQAAGIMRERFGREEVQDLDALSDRVFLFPRRGLHLGEAGAHDDFDVGAAQTASRPAAVLGRVAAASYDHAPADRRDTATRNARQHSMAVLPPPNTTARRPIDETWPNETLASRSMPI